MFARHNVTSLKKKRALTGYARMIARKDLTPEQNQRVTDMLKQHRMIRHKSDQSGRGLGHRLTNGVGLLVRTRDTVRRTLSKQ